jgi:hypothetical protein
LKQSPIKDCKCLVCGGAGRDTLYVSRVDASLDRERYVDVCGRTRGFTRGEWITRLDVVCKACGTTIDIASLTGSSPLIEGFIERVYVSIDPSTPEQRAAAQALEDAARKTRDAAAELEAKARKLRRGEQ